MPKPPKITKDLRIEAKLLKRIQGALDALEPDTATLWREWSGVPEKARPDVLAHCPTVARLVAFARRWV